MANRNMMAIFFNGVKLVHPCHNALLSVDVYKTLIEKSPTVLLL
jgi:hypothetical protein